MWSMISRLHSLLSSSRKWLEERKPLFLEDVATSSFHILWDSPIPKHVWVAHIGITGLTKQQWKDIKLGTMCWGVCGRSWNWGRGLYIGIFHCLHAWNTKIKKNKINIIILMICLFILCIWVFACWYVCIPCGSVTS